MGALQTEASQRSEPTSLEARLAHRGRAVAARVLAERPPSFLERFVREPSPQAVRFVSEFGHAFGFPPPRDLVGFTTLASLRPVLADFDLLRLPEGTEENALDAFVRHGGSGALLGLLIGALPIARSDLGETFYAALDEGLDEPLSRTPRLVSRDAVFGFSWVKRALVGPLTRDLSSFAYAAALVGGRRAGEIDEASFVACAERLRPHVARRSPFAELEKATRRAGSPYVAPRSATLQRFLRALWIHGLLADDGVFSLDDVRRLFSPRHNAQPTRAVWERFLRAMPTQVPTALYALFRSYFFEDTRRLAEAIEVCSASPARLIADSARFFDDVVHGRRDTLGALGSLSQARSAFSSLGLTSPPSSRARARAPGSERTPASTPSSSAHTLRARSLDELERRAWEKLGDEATHRAIFARLAERAELECGLAAIDYIDRDGHVHDNAVLPNEREEALLALGAHGLPVLVPLLVGRALREDLRAIDMLGALGDARAIPPLLSLLDRPSQRYRHVETSVVTALRALGARSAVPRLLALLADNPLRDWKEGLERGPLVKELVATLGALGDADAAGPIHELLRSQSLEVRPIVSTCAEALGRLRFGPAAPRLRELTRLAATLRDGVPAELVWALGQLSTDGEEGPSRDTLRAVELADKAADVVRVAALAKLGDTAPGGIDFEGALERAIWEPGFKREETSKRRVWAFRCLAELGGAEFDMDAVRYFVTLDDHAVRHAATEAFRLRGQRVPRVRPYFKMELPALERRGLDALHQALHDKNGVFRYNVALRIADIGHPSSVGPLVRSIRRLFEEPLTSTYEYDDAPHHLVWFCKALKRMRDPRGNVALIEGLSSTDPHVRAVVADDPPDDPRVVPELIRLLEDPRSFVRTRAERSLRAFRSNPDVERLLARRSVHREESQRA